MISSLIRRDFSNSFGFRVSPENSQSSGLVRSARNDSLHHYSDTSSDDAPSIETSVSSLSIEDTPPQNRSIYPSIKPAIDTLRSLFSRRTTVAPAPEPDTAPPPVPQNRRIVRDPSVARNPSSNRPLRNMFRLSLEDSSENTGSQLSRAQRTRIARSNRAALVITGPSDFSSPTIGFSATPNLRNMSRFSSENLSIHDTVAPDPVALAPEQITGPSSPPPVISHSTPTIEITPKLLMRDATVERRESSSALPAERNTVELVERTSLRSMHRFSSDDSFEMDGSEVNRAQKVSGNRASRAALEVTGSLDLEGMLSFVPSDPSGTPPVITHYRERFKALQASEQALNPQFVIPEAFNPANKAVDPAIVEESELPSFIDSAWGAIKHRDLHACKYIIDEEHGAIAKRVRNKWVVTQPEQGYGIGACFSMLLLDVNATSFASLAFENEYRLQDASMALEGTGVRSAEMAIESSSLRAFIKSYFRVSFGYDWKAMIIPLNLTDGHQRFVILDRYNLMTDSVDIRDPSHGVSFSLSLENFLRLNPESRFLTLAKDSDLPWMRGF